MVFEEVERKPVWCIHFWDMELYEGEVLGKESGGDNINGLYVRMKGAAINDIECLNSKNVFYSEKAAEKALFKAKLAGKKRKGRKRA
jgi:hypothetical protein